MDETIVVPSHLIAYAGNFDMVPEGVQELPQEFNKINVTDFKHNLDKLPEKAYYNNMYWLDFFQLNQVMICMKTKILPLTDFSLSSLCAEFLPGEITDMVLCDMESGRELF